MSSKNSNIISYIETTDSICNIIEKATSNKDFYNELKNYQITKSFEPLNAIYKIVIYNESHYDTTECELIFPGCENNNLNDKPTIRMLYKRRDIDFESQTNIIVENTADLSMENESKKLYHAAKHAQIIKYLLNKFYFASKLTIFNRDGLEKTDDFILLVIEKIISNKLEFLSPIYLHSIITFASKYDITEHDIFFGKPNLKVFTIHVSAQKIFEDKYLLIDKFWKFIDIIFNKKIQLKLIFDPDERSIFLTLTILNYSKKRNISVLVDNENDYFHFFSFIEKGIGRKDYELIKHLSSLTLLINTFVDFLNIESALFGMDNLESLKINFNRIIYSNIYKENIKFDDIRKIYNKIFNFKISNKKLKSIILEYQDNYYPPNFETFNFSNKLYDMFIISLFSILPNSITIMKFKNLPYLKEEYFEYLHKTTPNLDTIVFKHCKYLPDELLLLFKNLRNVFFVNNLGVTIPSWVEIVIYQDFNDYMYRNFFWPYLKKNNKEFYRLMKNCTFKHTFWMDKNCTADTVIFMKDILKWKRAINLLNL
uniref:BTB domain-containing protein n=1 Tax=Strongyloides venezuelensis TaxID=75913 RepID=A0A0K0FMZ5_STRVS